MMPNFRLHRCQSSAMYPLLQRRITNSEDLRASRGVYNMGYFMVTAILEVIAKRPSCHKYLLHRISRTLL